MSFAHLRLLLETLGKLRESIARAEPHLNCMTTRTVWHYCKSYAGADVTEAAIHVLTCATGRTRVPNMSFHDRKRMLITRSYYKKKVSPCYAYVAYCKFGDTRRIGSPNTLLYLNGNTCQMKCS